MNEWINCNGFHYLCNGSYQFKNIYIYFNALQLFNHSFHWLNWPAFDARKRMRKYANFASKVQFKWNWLFAARLKFDVVVIESKWKSTCTTATFLSLARAQHTNYENYVVYSIFFLIYFATLHNATLSVLCDGFILLQNTRLTFGLMPKGIQSENKTKWNVRDENSNWYSFSFRLFTRSGWVWVRLYEK